MSIPRHQATRAPAEGRGSGGASSDGAEAKRGNRAQLIGAAAVALVLVGTTAFVLLRESAPPPSEAPAAAQPAPQVPPLPPPSIPAPVAATPPVAPPPTPAETQPAPPAAAATPAPEPTEAEAKPASKHHKAAKTEPPASNGGAYTLQLDSFLVPENATALIARVNAHGGSAYEKAEPDGDGKTWHKVRVGAYDSEAEAEAAAEDLRKTDGIDALIVRTTAEDAK